MNLQKYLPQIQVDMLSPGQIKQELDKLKQQRVILDDAQASKQAKAS